MHRMSSEACSIADDAYLESLMVCMQLHARNITGPQTASDMGNAVGVVPIESRSGSAKAESLLPFRRDQTFISGLTESPSADLQETIELGNTRLLSTHRVLVRKHASTATEDGSDIVAPENLVAITVKVLAPTAAASDGAIAAAARRLLAFQLRLSPLLHHAIIPLTPNSTIATPTFLPSSRAVTDAPPAFFDSQEGVARQFARPYISQSVAARVAALPQLLRIEQQFIVFQMLVATAELHSTGCYHGALSLQNFLISTGGLVYLSDVASYYKPFLLELSSSSTVAIGYYETHYGPGGFNLPAYSYFAPERFFLHENSGEELARSSSVNRSSVELKTEPRRGDSKASPHSGESQSSPRPNTAQDTGSNSIQPSGVVPSILTGPGTDETGTEKSTGVPAALKLEPGTDPIPAPRVGSTAIPQKCDGKAADIFALGCCIAELFSNEHSCNPILTFRDAVSIALESNCGKTSLPDTSRLFKVLKNLPEEIQELVSAMCETSSIRRPSATECLELGRRTDLFPPYFFDLLLPLMVTVQHPLFGSSDVCALLLSKHLRYFTPAVVDEPDALTIYESPSAVISFIQMLLRAVPLNITGDDARNQRQLCDIMTLWGRRAFDIEARNKLKRSTRKPGNHYHHRSAELHTDGLPLPSALGQAGRIAGELLLSYWKTSAILGLSSTIHRRELWKIDHHTCMFLWPDTNSLVEDAAVQRAFFDALLRSPEDTELVCSGKDRRALTSLDRNNSESRDSTVDFGHFGEVTGELTREPSRATALDVKYVADSVIPLVNMVTSEALTAKFPSSRSFALCAITAAVKSAIRRRQISRSALFDRIFPLHLHCIDGADVSLSSEGLRQLADLLACYAEIEPSFEIATYVIDCIWPYLEIFARSQLPQHKTAASYALPKLTKALLSVPAQQSNLLARWLQASASDLLHAYAAPTSRELGLSLIESAPYLAKLLAPGLGIILPFFISLLNSTFKEVRRAVSRRALRTWTLNLGGNAVEGLMVLLPCLEGALNDIDEDVISAALQSFFKWLKRTRRKVSTWSRTSTQKELGLKAVAFRALICDIFIRVEKRILWISVHCSYDLAFRAQNCFLLMQQISVICGFEVFLKRNARLFKKLSHAVRRRTISQKGHNQSNAGAMCRLSRAAMYELIRSGNGNATSPLNQLAEESETRSQKSTYAVEFFNLLGQPKSLSGGCPWQSDVQTERDTLGTAANGNTVETKTRMMDNATGTTPEKPMSRSATVETVRRKIGRPMESSFPGGRLRHPQCPLRVLVEGENGKQPIFDVCLRTELKFAAKPLSAPLSAPLLPVFFSSSQQGHPFKWEYRDLRLDALRLPKSESPLTVQRSRAKTRVAQDVTYASHRGSNLLEYRSSGIFDARQFSAMQPNIRRDTPFCDVAERWITTDSARDRNYGKVPSFKPQGIHWKTLHHHQTSYEPSRFRKLRVDSSSDHRLIFTGPEAALAQPCYNDLAAEIHIWDSDKLVQHAECALIRSVSFQNTNFPTTWCPWSGKAILCFGNYDGKINLCRVDDCNTSTKHITQLLKGPKLPILDLTMAETALETCVASLYANASIGVWDIRCPDLSILLRDEITQRKSGIPTAFAASKDSALILTTGSSNGIVASYDIRFAARPLSQFQIRCCDHCCPISTMAYSYGRDGGANLIVALTNHGNEVAVCNPFTGDIDVLFVSKNHDTISKHRNGTIPADAPSVSTTDGEDTDAGPTEKSLPGVKVTDVAVPYMQEIDRNHCHGNCTTNNNLLTACPWRSTYPQVAPVVTALWTGRHARDRLQFLTHGIQASSNAVLSASTDGCIRQLDLEHPLNGTSIIVGRPDVDSAAVSAISTTPLRAKIDGATMNLTRCFVEMTTEPREIPNELDLKNILGPLTQSNVHVAPLLQQTNRRCLEWDDSRGNVDPSHQSGYVTSLTLFVSSASAVDETPFILTGASDGLLKLWK